MLNLERHTNQVRFMAFLRRGGEGRSLALRSLGARPYSEHVFASGALVALLSRELLPFASRQMPRGMGVRGATLTKHRLQLEPIGFILIT